MSSGELDATQGGGRTNMDSLRQVERTEDRLGISGVKHEHPREDNDDRGEPPEDGAIHGRQDGLAEASQEMGSEGAGEEAVMKERCSLCRYPEKRQGPKGDMCVACWNLWQPEMVAVSGSPPCLKR